MFNSLEASCRFYYLNAGPSIAKIHTVLNMNRNDGSFKAKQMKARQPLQEGGRVHEWEGDGGGRGGGSLDRGKAA